LKNWVSLPLAQGDAVFFSPALFHAAGENVTADVHRSANLIQVSSAFGKPMETIDAVPLIRECYDALQSKFRNEGESVEVDACIRAIGEGYPFPTNLDRRPPAPGGMAPESEQDIIRKALKSGWGRERVVEELIQMQKDGMA
jgi:ectoine hydroxylase-related dioxygenase (phytanoyl-CoA dioxygenase family)